MTGFDHFNHLAPFYDKAIPFSTLKDLLECGEFQKGDHVLDAGGGTGRVATAIQPFVREVIVADVSKGMLVQAAKKGLPTLLAPVELLPFQSNTFDRIVMIDALHHVKDQSDTANEIWRILKPGGKIIIEEPDVRRFSVKIMAVAEKIALMRSHFLSPVEISGLFKIISSEVTINCVDNNAWIIVRKQSAFKDKILF